MGSRPDTFQRMRRGKKLSHRDDIPTVVPGTRFNHVTHGLVEIVDRSKMQPGNTSRVKVVGTFTVVRVPNETLKPL